MDEDASRGESWLPLRDEKELLSWEAGGGVGFAIWMGGATILTAWLVLVGRMKFLRNGFSIPRYSCLSFSSFAMGQRAVKRLGAVCQIAMKGE